MSMRQKPGCERDSEDYVVTAEAYQGKYIMKYFDFNQVKNGLSPYGLFHRVQHLASTWRHGTSRLRRSRERTAVEAPAVQTVAAFRAFSKWASIIALLVGYHVLLGWIFNIGILKSPWLTFPTMKVNEALCALLAGLGLYLLQTRDSRLPSKLATGVKIAGGLVVLITGLTLLQRLFSWPIGIDNLLLPGSVSEDPGAAAPGQMSLMSAIAFATLGVSLLLMDSRRGYRAAEILSLFSAAVGLLAIASYIYQAEPLQAEMPLYSAIVVFLIAGGLLCARAHRGLMAKVTSNSFGGIMARRLLPATLLIPIVLGWLQHRGERAGLYEAEPGLALFAVANVLLFLFVVWWGVSSLHRMDTKRRQAEHELQETAAKLSRSNADLEQFAYVASHDLKEPLRAISGSVQILQARYKNMLEPGADEIIKHTVDGATRMQTLIDDLLTYSRLTTREAASEPTDCAPCSGKSSPISNSRSKRAKPSLPRIHSRW